MIQFGKRRRRTSTTRQGYVESLEERRVLAAAPIITEFQAVNDSTFADVDGDFSDWIEIHNPDDTAISLDNWFVTDDKTNLQKWQFPAGATLGPGEYKLVIASGKDRSRAEEELHTNFRLSGDGEYLGLVKPDGITTVQEFDPFPEQVADLSFGLAAGRAATEVIAQGNLVKALVPEDDTWESRWIEPELDVSQWITGTAAVGYEVLNAGDTQRSDFDALGPEWTIDNPDAATVSVGDGTLTLNVPPGQITTSNDRGRAPIVFRDAPTFPDGSPAQSWEIVTQITQQADDTGHAGIVVMDGATGVPVIKLRYDPASIGRFEMRVLDSRVDSTRVGNDSYFLRLARNNLAKTWSAYFKFEEADDWTQIARTVDGQDGMPVIAEPKPALYAETEGDDTTNVRFDFVEIAINDEMPIYGPSMGLDVLNQLKDRNSSIYMRIPFSVDTDPVQFDELSMAVRFDDGYRAYLNGVLVSEENAPLPPPPPNPDILSWDARAQGTHGANNGRIAVNHIDLTEHLGLLRQGDNVLAVQGLNVSGDDDDFFFDARLIASNLVSEKAQFFAQPSPGQANSVPSPLAPRIVADEGIFFDSKTVEIELAEPLPNLEIRYTLDGSEPNSESLLYEGPITLSSSAMLQARTFDKSDVPTLDPSPVSTATFVAAEEQLRNRTSDIPIIILDTLEQSLIPATSNSLTSVNVVAVEVSKATGRAALDNGVVDYLGRGGIRDRGSSTAEQPKPNLAFETWGPDGSDRDDDYDVPLLGFSAESDWVLHAPFHYDRAMIRNQLAFDLSNQMGQWAPATRAVEVYLNRGNGSVGEDDYMGVYVLMEKIKQGEDRVDVAQIDRDDNSEPEISGGYIWKIDRPDPDARGFSGGGLSVNWVYPKSPSSRTARDDQKATDEQQEWVIQRFDDVRDALQSTDIADPNGYSQLVDIRSWVDQHLLNVLLQNGDAFTLSSYFHKDRDGKIAMGPAWDFDRSAESLDDRDNTPELWGRSSNRDYFSRGWYTLVFRDAGFWQAYVDRWTELRRTTLSLSNLDATIDKLADEIRESQERNFVARVNRIVQPRRGSAFDSGKLDGTWQGEVEHARQWMHDRLKFIDSNFVEPPVFVQNGEPIEKVDPDTLVERTGVRISTGEQIAIRAPLESSLTANIYYTTDGSDPRGPDGNPAPTAQLLARGESIATDQNTRIIARNFDDEIDRGPEARVVGTDWSAPIGYDFIVATPQLVGDFDGNGVVDTSDINLLFEQIRSDNPDLGFDLNRDGLVDTADRDFMVESILETDMGDANLDGIFNSSDLVLLLQVKHYEDGISLNSKWEHGDWDADGDFTSRDLVLAFQNGGYVAAALEAFVYHGEHGGTQRKTVSAHVCVPPCPLWFNRSVT